MSFEKKSLKSLPPPYIAGERFKEKREALGWTIEDLAKRTTFSKNQIQQIENGLSSSFYSANIKFNSAKKIAGVLQLSEEEAFKFNDASMPIPIHEPELNLKQSSEELQEDSNDNPININQPGIDESNPTIERAQARNTLQLKILITCLIFLGVLFTFHNSDSFSTLFAPKLPEEKQILPPEFKEESMDIDQSQKSEIQPGKNLEDKKAE